MLVEVLLNIPAQERDSMINILKLSSEFLENKNEVRNFLLEMLLFLYYFIRRKTELFSAACAYRLKSSESSFSRIVAKCSGEGFPFVSIRRKSRDEKLRIVLTDSVGVFLLIDSGWSNWKLFLVINCLIYCLQILKSKRAKRVFNNHTKCATISFSWILLDFRVSYHKYSLSENCVRTKAFEKF